MDEEKNFGGDIVSISDEDGNNYELEHLDTIEVDGVCYMSFLPADIDEDDERYGMLILKSEEGSDGENYFVIPSDEEIAKVYDLFMERLFDEDDTEEDE